MSKLGLTGRDLTNYFSNRLSEYTITCPVRIIAQAIMSQDGTRFPNWDTIPNMDVKTHFGTPVALLLLAYRTQQKKLL